MIIDFDEEYLEELYSRGKCTGKKHRFQEGIIKNYIKRVNTLKNVRTEEDLFVFKSLNYEKLEGNKLGLSSVRINDKYRLEFKLEALSEEPIITICTIFEITNHYK